MRQFLLPFLLINVLLSCAPEPKIPVKLVENLDVQGHRGARGLFPENSIEGFIAALDLGVNTLEMDLVISKDAEVVVSHEPWMNSEICLDALGEIIPKEREKDYLIYEMSLDAIQNYDCGSKENPNFPNQKKIKTYKPTLEEVVLKADEHAQASGLPMPHYNLEIKRVKGYDGVYHPASDFYVQVVMTEIQKLGIEERTTIQSFDIETLQYMYTHFHYQDLAYLVADEDGTIENLRQLTIPPDIYSPNFALLTEKDMEILRARNIKVIPWTVNEVEDMKRLILLGVDGIITDYPDRLMNLIREIRSAHSIE